MPGTDMEARMHSISVGKSPKLLFCLLNTIGFIVLNEDATIFNGCVSSFLLKTFQSSGCSIPITCVSKKSKLITFVKDPYFFSLDRFIPNFSGSGMKLMISSIVPLFLRRNTLSQLGKPAEKSSLLLSINLVPADVNIS